MFSGLVELKLPFFSLQKQEKFYELTFKSQIFQEKETWLGDSIAVNGACLTVSAIDGDHYSFQISEETLLRSAFKKSLEDSDFEHHLEWAVKLGSRLGGHLVSGHVDGVARLQQRLEKDRCFYLTLELTGESRERIAPFLVEKASVTVNGTSLTVNKVFDSHEATSFDLCLIPHTLQETHLGSLALGDFVNVEADLMAKHWCRFQDYQKLSKPEATQDQRKGCL